MTEASKLVTTACSIGKHVLCEGIGNLGPSIDGEVFTCECPCHASPAPIPDEGA